MGAPANQKKMSYEGLVEECKRLRLAAEQSEARYFLLLMTTEKEYADVWRGAGHSTYEQFLRSNDLCKPDQYLAFRDGVNKVGPEKAMSFGAHWTRTVGRMRHGSVERLAERAEAFLKVHHTAPSEEVVKGWARDEPKDAPVVDINVRRLSELEKLRKENAELRAKLAEANRTIAKLEQQVSAKKEQSKR